MNNFGKTEFAFGLWRFLAFLMQIKSIKFALGIKNNIKIKQKHSLGLIETIHTAVHA